MILPVLDVTAIVLIPLPPRPWTLYSFILVFLPIPFSDTTNSSKTFILTRLLSKILIPTTSSVDLSLIARTPEAVRPIARTSFSLNLIDCPMEVVIMMSLLPAVGWTHSSISSSFNFRAIRPDLRTFLKSSNFVFLILPLLVTITSDS